MIEFAYPAALLLILPLLALWQAKPFAGRTVQRLRLALYAVLVLALSGISVKIPGRSGLAVAIADRSRSMPPESGEAELRAVRLLDSKRPKECSLGAVSFAAGTAVEKVPDPSRFENFSAVGLDPDGSSLADALESALAMIPSGTPGRILLMTDGRWTGRDPASAFARAAARGIAVDWMKLARPSAGDCAVAELVSPLSAAPGEYYTLSARIVSPQSMRAKVSVSRNGGPWSVRTVELAAGITNVSWRDRSQNPGIADYRVRVEPENPAFRDGVPENNLARKLVEIRGRKDVLLLTESPSGNLGRILREAGMPVTVSAPSAAALRPENLAQHSGVILENVPAKKLGPGGMNALAEAVRAGALGLFMTGGKNSFQPGGYYRSPLEAVLPVSLEQKRDLRKKNSAVMIALDRSGSMAVSAGSMTKMDLADLAAAEVLKLMMPGDEFGVIAVDSSAHTVIPLTPAEEISGGEARIRSIESMGGGIFCYTALDAAAKELYRSKAPVRHLILFADAADAEEPGNYQFLLEQTSKAGITVSVVGLGTEADSDAVFLKDIARRGNGIVYFSDRPEELPRIFAEDTFVMVRNTFVDTPAKVVFTPASHVLMPGAKLPPSAELGGYNLLFPKKDCELLMAVDDDDRAPIAAAGQAGLGRAAVFAGEADGAYSGRFASDPAAAPFLAALADSVLVPEEGSGEWFVSQEIVNGIHRVTLELDPAREQDPFRTPPVVTALSQNADGSVRSEKYPFAWVSADRLEAEIPLRGGSVQLGTVSWPGKRPFQIAPAVLPYSPEFRPETHRPGESDAFELAASSGGVERLRPEELWRDIPKVLESKNLSPWLLVLAAALLLLETAERRLKLLTGFRKTKQPAAAAPVPKEKRLRTVPSRAVSLPPEEAPVPKKEAPPEEDSLGDAFRRAKRK